MALQAKHAPALFPGFTGSRHTTVSLAITAQALGLLAEHPCTVLQVRHHKDVKDTSCQVTQRPLVYFDSCGTSLSGVRPVPSAVKSHLSSERQSSPFP